MKFELALVCVVSAYAQTTANFEVGVHAAMAPSLAQQRASVRAQAVVAAKMAAASAVGSSFFTEAPPIGLGLLAECDPLTPDQLNGIITGAAQKEKVSFDLIKAVVEEESAARPCAVSFQGAEGLMQLMPATAEQFNVQDPFDPEQNINAGAKMLRLLLTKYDDDLGLALSAYNAGSGRVDQEGGIPPIAETLNYVADILRKSRPTEGKPTEPAPTVAASEHKDQ
ncbi:MAG TPA: lytic transglycosylase domain-containing protein [Bryobacteraceae bacterium]|jgi:soluble lytic murein transglycosylase-like protein|nr:lytic transglycosylase domain-containing protein [Bryobacteraceae bacterium]